MLVAWREGVCSGRSVADRVEDTPVGREGRRGILVRPFDEKENNCSLSTSSAEIQLQRLMQRDNCTREAARSRLQAQLPITEKLEYADVVLDNSGTKAELEVQVEGFARRLYLDAGWSWRLKWLIPPLGLLSAISTLVWRRVKKDR